MCKSHQTIRNAWPFFIEVLRRTELIKQTKRTSSGVINLFQIPFASLVLWGSTQTSRRDNKQLYEVDAASIRLQRTSNHLLFSLVYEYWFIKQFPARHRNFCLSETLVFKGNRQTLFDTKPVSRHSHEPIKFGCGISAIRQAAS